MTFVEVGVVLDKRSVPCYWHLPSGRTAVSLPDNRTLWDVLWERRETLSGFAHSHPGSGVPVPSWEDLTTFSAVEAGLGKRLSWYIVSSDRTAVFRFVGPGKYDYRGPELLDEPPFVAELRSFSSIRVKEA